MSPLLKIRQAGFDISLIGNGRIVVTPADCLTHKHREFIKQHKPEIIAELAEKKIISWLGKIGESCPDLISETLLRCKTDHDTLNYYLQRADGITSSRH